MRQVHNVGRHRGWFVRRYPRTSARPVYFAPSLALLAVPAIALWGLAGSAARRRAMLAAVAAGWGAVSAEAVRRGASPEVAATLPAVLAAGHCAYGAGFIEGVLFTREIHEM